MGVGSSIRRFVWGDIPQSKAERKLLIKIDWFILSYCCLMYFTNYLDRSNISNAYVSGMKEELNMVGNQYNQINTIFTCGYIVGMIPNNLMLQIVPPRIWFPCMHVTWGVLTFWCSNSLTAISQSVFAIRFFQGMAESSTFVGTHYILGSWYKSGELGKRSGIFTSSGLAGTLFSGVLQAAIFHNLNGVSGRSGWRWLFIIDGIITLPIALYGFLIFPDVPANTRAFYLSEEERSLASERMESRQDLTHERPHRSLFERVLGRWRWYGCSLLFAISGETESFGSNNLMGQWLKAIGGYTVEQIDYYPSGMTAFAIASTLVCATWTDWTRSRARWPVLVYMSVCTIIASICILVWSSPIGLKFFAYYLAGASYAGQATTFAWANQICADDAQERAIVLASMNMWNNVINAWWPLVFYRATDAPKFTKGMWAMIGVSIATLGVTWLVWYLERREWRVGAKRTNETGRSETEEVGRVEDGKSEKGRTRGSLES
ncbi:MFS general substrate transporter [Cristinia sonorae]|uniref:MFS general substrate transporter n=1 Tax=Cristinia sonorae TaxID=1940300 RepID=A0A8K0UWG9_9AGAR|nr:MFS general substrate transporter [Cristinia sonorae]